MISHGILLICPELYQIWTFFATTKKLSINVESPHFPTFSAKKKRDCHGKSRNCQGKVMEKYFVKSVGTLLGDIYSVIIVSARLPGSPRSWTIEQCVH